MTREEIIEQLESIVGTYEILLGHGVNSDILDVDDIEAIKEAISALSADGDLISRQATVERLCKVAEFMNEKRDGLGSPYVMAALFIQDNKEEFPSVTPKQSEWIPVSERLPEKKVKDYLACCEDGYVATIMYDNGRWLINGNNVIAWMPLPEPYKAESEDT